jgi:hypothetical protein
MLCTDGFKDYNDLLVYLTVLHQLLMLYGRMIISKESVTYVENYYLLGYNAVWSIVSQLKFWRNISSPSSGSKNKPSKKLA